MITVFGATGYTGSLIASALDREGLAFRIAGRSAQKLSLLSEKLASKPAWVVADAAVQGSLMQLFKDTHLLINCAGPFTDIGERVLSQSAASGVHYLDTTNELNFVYRSQTYHALAQRSRAALIPACGFEVAVSDCAVKWMSAEITALPESVDVAYHLSVMNASRGTRLSILRTLATSWIAYENGAWKGAVPGRNFRVFGFQSGRHPATEIPSAESVTIPRHTPVHTVRVWMTGPPALVPIAPVVIPLLSRLLRSWPGRSALWAAGLSTKTPGSATLKPAPFEIIINLHSGSANLKYSLSGSGPYELTAEIILSAAKAILSPGFERFGVLSPAQIIDPASIFPSGNAWGLRVQKL